MSSITVDSLLWTMLFFLIFALINCLFNIANYFLEKEFEHRSRRKYYEKLQRELKRRY